MPRDRIHSATGLILRTEKSVLFVIPWGSHWIIGTTDTDWNARQGPPRRQPHRHRLPARPCELACCRTPLTREDVEGVYAGLRPLLAGESDVHQPSSPASTPSPSPVPGLVVVAGGKYTTYRVMAKDAVDAAVHGLERTVAARRAPSASRCSAPTATGRCGTRGTDSPPRTGLHVARIEHLLTATAR